MNTLIIAPLQEELDFILQSFVKNGYQSEQIQTGLLITYRLPELGITLARGGTGKAQFAAQTQHLLDADSTWELVICAGAAGSLDNKLSIGDLVVATKTIEHDFNNRFSQRPLPSFDGDQIALDELSQLKNLPAGVNLYFGAVASGDEDIVEDQRARALQRSTGALVAAWEGAGGARACRFSGVSFLEIRGVTDTADHNAPADFEDNLEVAMTNIALLVASWFHQR